MKTGMSLRSICNFAYLLIDFTKVYSEDPKQIFTDEKSFMTTPRTELYLLACSADIKAFHLENALEDSQQMQDDLAAALKK